MNKIVAVFVVVGVGVNNRKNLNGNCNGIEQQKLKRGNPD